jgi:lysophospholipase L1-like esterase
LSPCAVSTRIGWAKLLDLQRGKPMRRLTAYAYLRTALLCSALACSALPLAAQENQSEKADRWEKEISAMTAKDDTNPPRQGGIVFVGSSSIRLWDLKKSFPDLPVVNRGFGGSQLADSVQYAKRIVTPYQPKTVVLYAGDNDLASGKKSPEQIAKDFDQFVSLVREQLPESKIVYIAVKPSPSRWKLIEQMNETNRLIRERCEQGEKLVYLDIAKPMLDKDGQPRPELYKPDMLHMNDDGYKIWADLLNPHLN